MHPRVLEYIGSKPEAAQALFWVLRDEIFRAAPEAREDWKWSLPMYFVGRPCFYLQFTKERVVLSFMHGVHLSDPEGLFEWEDQKQVRHVRFSTEQDIPLQQLRALMDCAVQWNHSL